MYKVKLIIARFWLALVAFALCAALTGVVILTVVSFSNSPEGLIMAWSLLAFFGIFGLIKLTQWAIRIHEENK